MFDNHQVLVKYTQQLKSGKTETMRRFVTQRGAEIQSCGVAL